MEMTLKVSLNDGTGYERRYLRWAGISGLAPLPLFAAIFVLRFDELPYPPDNVDGKQYIDYMTVRHSGELGAICWICASLAIMMFVVLLALVYMRRAGRATASGVVLLVGAAAFVAVNSVLVALYVEIVQLSRGYPSFGSGPADHMLATFAWDASNVVFLMNGPIAAVMWAAIAVANRTHPLLPRALGGWCAIAVSAVSAFSLAFIFVYTGNWSPGSTFEVAAQMGPTVVWTMAISVFLFARTGKSHSVVRARGQVPTTVA